MSGRAAAAAATIGCIAVLGIAWSGADAWLVATAGIAGLGAAALIALLPEAPPRAATGEALPPSAPPGGRFIPAILEALHDPVVVLDAAGRVVFANRASSVVLGQNPERKHISAVLRAPQFLEALARVGNGGPPETVAFSFLVPVERHFEAYVSASGDGARSVILQFHDLTSARRAEQMRADFIANASHELRTPLAAVAGFIDTLRGHAKEDPAAREKFLEIMGEETERMRRLIDNLLSLTRIELNEHIPPSGIVDIVAVAQTAADVLSPLAEQEGVRIVVAPCSGARVIGDRDELIQVFQNLIHNAIKYGRTGGTVRIGFGRIPDSSPAGLVYGEIKDEGEGIPAELIPRLTERFYRADTRRSRERSGTGLGLAIVKHIVNRHQGRLSIASTPGEGSTFTVFLPASP